MNLMIRMNDVDTIDDIINMRLYSMGSRYLSGHTFVKNIFGDFIRHEFMTISR